MLIFNRIYQPLTSRPFLCNQSYMEYQPCELLRPYVSCYWVSDVRYMNAGGETVFVVPDTCMDIIVRVNHTKQVINGYLCGIQDYMFETQEQKSAEDISCFAVRFYFWGAHLFLDLDYGEIKNQSLPLNMLGREWDQLFERFFEVSSTQGRIGLMENFLLGRLNQIKLNHNLFNSFQYMLMHPGTSSIKDICDCSCISQRQMERLYQQHIGLSLKRVSNLVRYQKVWREMVTSCHFNVHDAVHRFGYTDQAHLLKEFKRFHGVTPTKAREIAYNSMSNSYNTTPGFFDKIQNIKPMEDIYNEDA